MVIRIYSLLKNNSKPEHILTLLNQDPPQTGGQ